jgi:hypothetical protein
MCVFPNLSIVIFAIHSIIRFANSNKLKSSVAGFDHSHCREWIVRIAPQVLGAFRECESFFDCFFMTNHISMLIGRDRWQKSWSVVRYAPGDLPLLSKRIYVPYSKSLEPT